MCMRHTQEYLKTGESRSDPFTDQNTRSSCEFPDDFNILPAYFVADAGPCGFGKGLLGSKTCSVVGKGIGTRRAIPDLGWCENPVQKPVSVVGNRFLNPGNFDQVNPDSGFHGRLVVVTVGSVNVSVGQFF